MLSELPTGEKVVGLKQCKKAIKDGLAIKAFIADDASQTVTDPLITQCFEKGVPVVRIDTMKELGTACGIDVGASVAVLVR